MLSEFARDANGTLQSALFAVTRGTFAFVAGRLAKTGSLMVDTPVGSIRSRAQAGGIGMLSFAALIFSAMKEAQAADPNVTFLDDDTITYKDLEHGVFELITKEAIPRHIIVEDPGETVVLSRKRVLGQRERGREFSYSNAGVAGGPTGRARQLCERAGTNRVQHPSLRQSATGGNQSILFRLTPSTAQNSLPPIQSIDLHSS